MRSGARWREGFAFLWRQPVLLANTLLSTVAQVAVGAEIVVSLLYARDVVDRGALSFEQMYALLLTAIAVGSVLAGIVVGAIGDRLPEGTDGDRRLHRHGPVAGRWPGSSPIRSWPSSPSSWSARFNMVFIIPTVTLFQERTPQRLMGRVVSSRQALVFGSIAASMGLSGYLAGIIGPAAVLVLSGAICAAAGAVGILIPPMRNAR